MKQKLTAIVEEEPEIPATANIAGVDVGVQGYGYGVDGSPYGIEYQLAEGDDRNLVGTDFCVHVELVGEDAYHIFAEIGFWGDVYTYALACTGDEIAAGVKECADWLTSEYNEMKGKE